VLYELGILAALEAVLKEAFARLPVMARVALVSVSPGHALVMFQRQYFLD
jgi:hypothetical protein